MFHSIHTSDRSLWCFCECDKGSIPASTSSAAVFPSLQHPRCPEFKFSCQCMERYEVVHHFLARATVTQQVTGFAITGANSPFNENSSSSETSCYPGIVMPRVLRASASNLPATLLGESFRNLTPSLSRGSYYYYYYPGRTSHKSRPGVSNCFYFSKRVSLMLRPTSIYYQLDHTAVAKCHCEASVAPLFSLRPAYSCLLHA